MTDEPSSIVGASLAGAKAAEAARAAGFDGRIVLVGDEPERPYERPPLSKDVLRGEKPPETTRVHDDGYYDEHGIELLTGRTVEALDLGAGQVPLDGGETLRVHHRGAGHRRRAPPPRHCRAPTSTASTTCARWPTPAGSATPSGARRRVAVIGAGWIGSEVAASARQMGAEVVLIDPRAGAAPAGARRPRSARCSAALHADHGVELRLGTGVDRAAGHRPGRAGRS